MIFKNKTISIKSQSAYDFTDLTDQVKTFVKNGGLKNGLVNVQILHTSAGLILNECDEPLLRKDLKNHLEKFAPQSGEYHHDNYSIRTVNLCDDECDNGHSHCKATILPSTLTLGCIDGKIQLGTYQKIFFIELDRARDRRVQIILMGQ
jgi:secondary thiamine-phosphate synthase enzyme